jgi:hypothetical protein
MRPLIQKCINQAGCVRQAQQNCAFNHALKSKKDINLAVTNAQDQLKPHWHEKYKMP